MEPSVDSRTRVSIPEHVVFRPFVTETVVLNLKTGLYHGLNPTAGRMLELLQETGYLEQAAERLAEEAGVELERVLQDMTSLCRDLAERDIVALNGARSG